MTFNIGAFELGFNEWPSGLQLQLILPVKWPCSRVPPKKQQEDFDYLYLYLQNFFKFNLKLFFHLSGSIKIFVIIH